MFEINSPVMGKAAHFSKINSLRFGDYLLSRIFYSITYIEFWFDNDTNLSWIRNADILISTLILQFR